jgi:hypothetical protein
MTLTVAIFAWGILRVVNPGPADPLYVFLTSGTCRIEAGVIQVDYVPNRTEPDPEYVPQGTVTQGELVCDLDELVWAGNP